MTRLTWRGFLRREAQRNPSARLILGVGGPACRHAPHAGGQSAPVGGGAARVGHAAGQDGAGRWVQHRKDRE